MDLISVLALWPYLLPVVAGGAVWAMRRSFASTERVERLENRMTEMETRYASIPGTEDVHEMRLRIAELSAISGCCPSGCSHFPINWSCCLKTQ